MTKFSYLFLIIFSFSCTQYPKAIEEALRQAGDNRAELEKVLQHYSKNPTDTLKLKAACFLIENMDVHSFVHSPELASYYQTLDSIFSLNNREDRMTEKQDSLLTQMILPNPYLFSDIDDIRHVSAELIIDNIDRAFEAWKSPFAKDMNFDDFCEFLLPYKVGAADYPDFWRAMYHDTFYPFAKFRIDTLKRIDSGVILQYPHLELDGKNFLSLPDGIFDSVPEFSMSCWIEPDEHKSYARVFDFGSDYNCYVCFIPYTKDRISKFEIVTNSPHYWNIATSEALPLTQRTHIAITYANNYISFYINGVSQKRLKTTLTTKDLISNYIGKSHYDGDTVYFKGKIYDFRIYDRELNYTEISAIAGQVDLPDMKQRLLDVLRIIRYLYNVNNSYDQLIQGGIRPVQYMNLKKGSCGDYTVMVAYIFRSLGIPVGHDFIPQWASCSRGHEWNVFNTGNGWKDDYSMGAFWDTIGHHLTSDEKMGKIFRHTYAKQPNTPAMQHKKGEYLPFHFSDPCIKDVTDSYQDCKDITVLLNEVQPRKSKFGYLCNFDNREWIPVHWGEIKNGKIVFTKMGMDIAYLPVYYTFQGIQPAAYPFILNKDGEIKKLIPDHSRTQTLILKRKYKKKNVLGKGELLVGGHFQVSNKLDFSDSLTVYLVNDVPEIQYNSVNLALERSYRYFRFLAPPHSRGDISEIEIYSTESGTKLSGKVIGNTHCPKGWEAENAFDNDPLTAYQCEWGERGWVGLDFGKSEKIAYFRYLPRNDDNFIKEGEEYELFYWNNNQWNSLGQQIGTSKQYLEYPNAPTNALFWLRNLTKGKEERIFTYENGHQVWW